MTYSQRGGGVFGIRGLPPIWIPGFETEIKNFDEVSHLTTSSLSLKVPPLMLQKATNAT